MRRPTILIGLAILTVLGPSSCGAPDEPAAVIMLSATSLSVNATKGGSNPASQTFTLMNGGGGTLNWSATDNADWLSVSPSAGAIESGATTPATVTVTVNIGTMAAGDYTGTVTIDGGAGVTPKTVTVTLSLAAQPVISLSATTYAFAGIQGGSNPADQTLTITNTGGSTLAWTATKTATWLTLSTSSGTAPSTVTLATSLAGLTPGTYTGSISIASTAAANTPQTVNVTLVVSAPPTIGLSPTSLTFSGVAGGAAPAAKTISVSNTGGSSLAWSASKDAAWLTISPASGTASSTITVTPSTTGLAAGTYSGTITITGTGATNTPQTVSVQLTVTPVYDGTWTGKTSQDSTITITISANAITQIVFGWRATGSCTVNGKTTTTFNTPLSVASGSFTHTSSGGTPSYTMSGTFGSATALSGTISLSYSQAFPSCSASGSATFTASKP